MQAEYESSEEDEGSSDYGRDCAILIANNLLLQKMKKMTTKLTMMMNPTKKHKIEKHVKVSPCI